MSPTDRSRWMVSDPTYREMGTSEFRESHQPHTCAIGWQLVTQCMRYLLPLGRSRSLGWAALHQSRDLLILSALEIR